VKSSAKSPTKSPSRSPTKTRRGNPIGKLQVVAI
jgi:hypothetical protein